MAKQAYGREVPTSTQLISGRARIQTLSLVLTAHSAGTAVKASPAGSFLPEAQPAVQGRISPGACCLCSCLLTNPLFLARETQGTENMPLLAAPPPPQKF